MEESKIDMFFMTYGSYFESHHVSELQQRLKSLDNSKFQVLQSLNLKNPTTILIVSILVGGFGVDRILIGDVGLGIIKLITCGGLGVWTIVDWFLIMGETRKKNYEKVLQFS
ncbi:MAG: TM2 domain-containing protein [Bacteroidota bacterium]